MNKLMFFSLLILLWGCSDSTSSTVNNSSDSTTNEKGGEYKIVVNIDNAEAGKVFLEQINGQNFVTKNTVDVDASGSFEMSGHVDEPDFYRVRFYNGQFFFIVLDAKEIKVTGDAKDMFATLKIEGSPDSELFMEFVKKNSFMTTALRNLQNEYNQRIMNGDQSAQAEYEQKYEQMAQQNLAYMKEVIEGNMNSVIAPYLASSLDIESDYDYIKQVADQIAEKQDNKYSRQLSQRVNQLKALSIGSTAPEIALPSPDGSIIKLSDYRGKYVLIDFWASWCRPCRAENPNVVRLYKQYKNKDFEIFGVSLDKSGDAWQKAIDNDGITWPQVSDLKFWQSEAAQLYQVNSIPRTFLLDKEGNIIAKNLRGAELEKKLAELLN